MNVRGAGFDRFGKNGIDQTNDRRIVFLLQQVLCFRDGIRERCEIHVIANAFDHLHGFGGIVLVGRVEGFVKSTRING